MTNDRWMTLPLDHFALVAQIHHAANPDPESGPLHGVQFRFGAESVIDGPSLVVEATSGFIAARRIVTFENLDVGLDIPLALPAGALKHAIGAMNTQVAVATGQKNTNGWDVVAYLKANRDDDLGPDVEFRLLDMFGMAHGTFVVPTWPRDGFPSDLGALFTLENNHAGGRHVRVVPKLLALLAASGNEPKQALRITLRGKNKPILVTKPGVTSWVGAVTQHVSETDDGEEEG